MRSEAEDGIGSDIKCGRTGKNTALRHRSRGQSGGGNQKKKQHGREWLKTKGEQLGGRSRGLLSEL